jgi:hypothetical protein
MEGQMTKVTLVDRSGRRAEFRVEGEAGYCGFTIWGDDRRLGSFGGSVWPGSFPDLFEHYGDPGVINVRSGYMVRADRMDELATLAA